LSLHNVAGKELSYIQSGVDQRLSHMTEDDNKTLFRAFKMPLRYLLIPHIIPLICTLSMGNLVSHSLLFILIDIMDDFLYTICRDVVLDKGGSKKNFRDNTL